MKFIEDLSIAYSNTSNINSYNINKIFNSFSLHFIPMLNPDGVDLVTSKINISNKDYINARNIANHYPSLQFPNDWKANIKGVDLNLQFPAGWENAKKIKYSQGFSSPAPRNFVGFSPLTEPEAIAIYNYTLSNNFDLMLTYHTQGKEIYWQFQNFAPDNSYDIGLEFANLSNYTLADVPFESSFAGFKDWFLQNFKKPAYTIEAGFGQNPLPISQFNNIYNDNLNLLLYSANL